MFVCYASQIVFYDIGYNMQNIPRSIFFTVFYLMELLLIFNSLVNPVIYCVTSQEFRRAFRELLHLKSSQVNVNIPLNELLVPRRQREGRSDSLNIRKHTAWEDLTPRLGSRSMDFSQAASHQSRIRRSNSV